MTTYIAIVFQAALITTLSFPAQARGRFDNLRLNETSFLIRYTGERHTTNSQRDREFLEGAAEATLQAGYDYFVFRVDQSRRASSESAPVMAAVQPTSGPSAPQATPSAADLPASTSVVVSTPPPAVVPMAPSPTAPVIPSASHYSTQGVSSYQSRTFVKDEPANREGIIIMSIAGYNQEDAFNAKMISQQSQTSVATPSEQSAVQSDKPRLAIHFGYPTASAVNFDEGRVTVPGDSARVEAQMTFDKSMIFGLELIHAPSMGWGYAIGGTLESARTIDTAEVTIDGQIQTVTDGTATLQMFGAYASGVYRFANVYIPIGFNISFPVYDNGGVNGGKLTYGGGIGGQLGIGFMISPQFALEFQSWAHAISMKSVTGTTTLDLGTGYQSSGVIQGKFFFAAP